MGSGRSFEVLLREAQHLLAEANAHELTDLTAAEVTDVAILSSHVAKLAEAAHLRLVGRLDVTKAWADDGSRSATDWIAWHCHIAKGHASGLLKCARQLREMPGTSSAMAAGRLTVDHVRLLTHAHQADPVAFADDEERLIDAAERLLFSAFERVIRYWVYAHAPDDAERTAAELKFRRR